MNAFTVNDYVIETAEKFRRARAIVLKNMEKEHAKMRERGQTTFQPKIGDLVWVSLPLRTDARTASKVALPNKFKF